MPESDWIAYSRERGRSEVRLICFPYAGAGVVPFVPWISRLRPAVDIGIVRLPGRESRLFEPLVHRLPEVIDQLCAAVSGTAPPPFAVLGHCTGALLAFELTRALEARGMASPELLVVAGQRAPHRLAARPSRSDLSDEEFVAVLREGRITPDGVLANPELLRLLLPALRADFALVQDYAAGPDVRLRTPICALAGADDIAADPGLLDAWAAHAGAGLTTRVLPGGHFFLFDEGSRAPETVAAELLARVRAADRS